MFYVGTKRSAGCRGMRKPKGDRPGRWGEISALTRQSRLIALGPFRSRTPLVGPRVVLFVHGFLATGEVLRPLALAVEKECRLPVATFPSPIYAMSFRKLVERLEGFVDQHVPRDAEVSLVGHSMGGLVCRWYAQECDRVGRVDRVITLATPHAGTSLARFAPASLRAALDPRGETIRQLHLGRSKVEGLPPVNIAAGRDMRVRPRSSALALEGASSTELEGVGHNELLYSQRTRQLVIDALR